MKKPILPTAHACAAAPARARRLLAPALCAALAACGDGPAAPQPESAASPGDAVAARPQELASWSLLKPSYRVAVVLYDFDNTPADPPLPNQNANINHLSVADVTDLAFGKNPARLDASSGSMHSYYNKLTEGYTSITGTVYDWLRLKRPDRVWRHEGSSATRCQDNSSTPQALTGRFCLDDIQPAPAGTNTWLQPASGPTCPDGTPSFVPAGNDWCNDQVILDANLVPTIQKALRARCPLPGRSCTYFDEADYDAVIYAGPYSIQGTYMGGKTIFTEARNRAYSMYAFTHELGHFFGLPHANTYSCSDGGRAVTLGGTCSSNEYGDPSSLMANPSSFELSSYEKMAIGVWPPSAALDISASGTYYVQAQEQSRGGPRAFRIGAGRSYPGTSSPGYYYLDYRQPLEYDGTFGAASPFTTGVALRLAPSFTLTSMHGGSPASLCGASCADYPSYSSELLLDGTPGSAGGFGDAPVPVGGSYTDRGAGVTLQVASRDAGGAQVDVTFRPTDARLFFYQPSQRWGNSYWLFPTGGMTFVNTAAGALPDWTHVVGANNGALLWYNAATGAAYTAYLDDGNVYHGVGGLTLPAGYSHVAAAGRGQLLFYRAATGEYLTATLSDRGAFTQRQTGAGWDRDWTHIVGTLQGTVVFYKAASGALLTWKLDGQGSFSNLRQTTTTAGWSVIAPVRESGLVLYRRGTGAVQVGSLDDDGALRLRPAGVAPRLDYTQIAGGLNGGVFFYAGASGASHRGSVDSAFTLSALSAVGGIAPSQILAVAGGR